ncbi:MAG: tandem-95 repeat protein [Candidatus Latescibacteria bacterium]|nr:tandem-95 repeat protein [Candidatus Latescibacterota bacterium]
MAAIRKVGFVLVLLAMWPALALGLPAVPGYVVSTFASGITGARGVSTDAAGNVYTMGRDDGRVIRISPTGSPTLVADLQDISAGYVGPYYDPVSGHLFVCLYTGNQVLEITGGIASAAGSVASPTGVTSDANGDLYVSSGAGYVYRIPRGGSPALYASGFSNPDGLVFGPGGNLYVGNRATNALLRVPAGGGSPVVVATGLGLPLGVTIDAHGDLYVADYNSGSIWKVSASGAKTNIGTGFSQPDGLAFDLSGNLYVAEFGANRVSKVAALSPPPNQPPVANSDAATTNEDTPIDIAVLGNDSDPDGDALSLTAVTQGAKGTVVILANQTVRYTPNANLNGPDSFTYTISDGKGGTATARVDVTITAVNDPPAAKDDTVWVPADKKLLINLTNDSLAFDSFAHEMGAIFNPMANDSDVDGDSLWVTAIWANDPRPGEMYKGRWSLFGSAGGGFEIFYTISDGHGGAANAIISARTLSPPPNQPPVASDDAVTTNEGTPIDIAVLANDSDPEGDSLYVVGASGASRGTTIPTTNQTVIYTPYSTNFYGSDSFTYLVRDSTGAIARARVDVTILPVNDPPVANNDAAIVARGQSVTIEVKANDSDVDGDALVVSSVSTPAKGTAAIADGKVVYTSTLAPLAANTNPALETDSFTYTLSDGQGGSATATVGLTICNPPAILSVPTSPLAVKQGMGIRLTAKATDPTTGQPVNAFPVLANAPRGAGGGINVFEWTPAFDQAGTYTVYFQAQIPFTTPVAKSVAISVISNRYPDLVVGGSRDRTMVPTYANQEQSFYVSPDGPKPVFPPYPPIRIQPVYKDGELVAATYTFSVPTFVGMVPSFTGPAAGVEIRRKYPRLSSPAFQTFSGSNGFQHAQTLPAAFGAFLQGEGNTRPAIGNLDGVGLSEFVVGGGCGSAGQLAVYSPTGGWTKTAQVNWPAYNAYNGETRPAVGDLNGDGRAEIVVGLGRGGWGALPVFGWEGTELKEKGALRVPQWDSQSDYNRLNGETRPAVGDLDGDGKAEVVVGLREGGGGRVGVFGSSPQGYVFKGWLTVRVGNTIFTGETRPAVGDLDGDGKAEIAVAHPAGPGASSPGIAIFSSEGVQVAYMVLDHACWPAIGDVLTPDGKGEIVLGAEGPKNLYTFSVTRNGTTWNIAYAQVRIETGKNNPIPAFGTIAGVPR